MLNNQEIKKPVLIEDLGMLYPTENSNKKIRYGLYDCGYCGNKFRSVVSDVKRDRIVSCGCYKMIKNITHGLRSHALYYTWSSMVKRCNNSMSKAYKDYGGRGILVCDRWLNINNFINDMYPSYIAGMEIDRIDNNKGYSKDNCRWSTRVVQTRNTRILKSNNTSGYRGVSFHKLTNKFQASISVNKKQVYLGVFIDSIKAAKAYDKYVVENNLEHTLNGVSI